MPTSDAVKVARIQASAEKTKMAKEITIAVLANPVTATMAMWLVNQTLYKAGFYNRNGDPTAADRTVNATAEWIGGFGIVEAAVVASKSINLPDLALKGVSALALLK